MKGYLMLSDGTKIPGTILGAPKTTIGEIVFNTGMTGYQEIVTDPSYFGQIVVLTYPMIGNYGVSKVSQSSRIQAKGLVIREMASLESNWSSEGSFEDYLIKHDLVAIKDVDTRHLTKMIREKGNMTAQIVVDDALVDWSTYNNDDAVYHVTTKEAYTMGDGHYHIAVMDYGIKSRILDQLLKRDFKLTVFPASTKAEDVLKVNPDGIFLSNGPGDPELLNDIVGEVKKLVASKPTFGICLGHQLLGRVFGAKTVKLKYGHRGPNHPVKDIALDKVVITSQNHGYMLDAETIDETILKVTHLNLNDDTIEGIKHQSLPIFSVQYHPEAAPGPDDSNYLFEQFENMIKEALC